MVTVTPTVTIAAFSPATSTRCQGAGSVTTTTTGTNSTGITYSLDAASLTGGNSINSATGEVTYVAGWSGTTTITASAAGCNGPATTTHVVTVTPTVTIAAFSPGTSTRCQGAGSVTTTTTGTNSTGITYSLDAASLTGGNSINSATGEVTYVAGWSGTTTITASAAGCNGPATTTHVVTVTPTVTIAAFSPGTSTRCQGAGTVTTTTTGTNSTGITYSLDAASLTGGNSINSATGEVTYAAGWSGTTTITASAAGCNGPATTTHVVTIGGLVSLSINDITSDNILNAAEAGTTIAVTGTVGGDFNVGDTVTLVVNGNTYTGVVDALGNYSIDVPGSDLAADGDTTVDGSFLATLTCSATDTQVYSVDTVLPVPTISVDDITADNVLNAAEAGTTIAVTGTVGGDFNVGDTVMLVVNGNTYTGVVDALGNYSIDVPGSDLAADGDTTVDASVSTTDGSGNTATANDTQVYSVDTVLPVPTISVDDITTDNILNAAEAGTTIAVTGTVGGDFNVGDTVTLVVNGNTYTGVVDALGNYSIDVPGSDLAADGDTTVDASVSTTDGSGNTATANDTQVYSVDTVLPVPTISVDDITADNILNAAEAGTTIAVTGTVGGDFNVGDTVTLVVNGNTYTGVVDALGNYSIDVPGSDLAADGDTTVDASVSTTDGTGNTATATDTQVYSVDTVLPVPTISVDDITTDNILNAAEAGTTIAVTGTVGGDFNVGDTVTLVLNGNTYTGVVDALGNYSIDVPGSDLAADGDTTVDASVSTTDGSGNTATASDTQVYSVDTVLPVPTISVDDITADNILNAAEAGTTIAVTGTVGGDFNVGDTVTLVVNGNTYTGVVDALGNYSIDVPGSDLAADGDTTVDASVSTTDGSGNTATAIDTQVYSVDTVLPVPTISVDDITADNVLNAAEAGTTIAVTGTVGGDFNVGDTVTLVVNGNTYTGVVDASGNYSIDVPGSDLAADGDTTVDASVSTTDGSGNTATANDTQVYSVDTVLPVPTISVDDITADNVLNAAEAGTTIAVTGTVGGDFNVGDTVTLVVNGNTYTGVVDALGNYSIDVPGSDLAADSDLTVDASVITEDSSGNTATANDTQVYSLKDTDGDGIPDSVDVDDDNDGIPDTAEGTGDTDGDGIPDSLDLDSDNDGILDVDEGGNGDLDTNGDGVIDSNDTGYVDADNDGQADDSVDTDEEPDTDGDGVPDYQDLDSDNDGINDVIENGNGDLDTNNDGIIDSNDTGGSDSDGDGISDSVDSDSSNFGEGNGGEGDTVDTDGDGVPDYQDLDSDNDGINDVIENGNGDLDTNNDGIIDSNDTGGSDSDGDGISDSVDSDSSNFGEGNGGEGDTVDTDGDGVPDYQDLDSDDDGINDITEGGNDDDDGNGVVDGPDSDGDGISDEVDEDDSGFGDSGNTDVNDTDPTDPDSGGTGVVTDSGTDSDGDGISDSVDGDDSGFGDATDTDGDGIPDHLDVDDDNDGIPDTAEGTGDTDGDGIPDSLDLDSDNDGILDVDEGGNGDLDTNGDGVIDSNDTGYVDADNDGQADNSVDTDEEPDTDGDGVPDYQDLDSDNDGINDVIENGNGDLDTNNDGVIDSNDTGGSDSDGDGISDSVDSDSSNFGEGDGGEGDTVDTDGDGVPDYQDLDSDDDGINDITEGGNDDMDGNGVVDGPDSDGDGISDEVDEDDSGFGDSGNNDNLPDGNSDGIPDVIDPNEGGGTGVLPDSGTDSDGDGIADSADLNDSIFGDAIGIDDCVSVYNEFTPNDDGSNDTLIIDCIENYPTNTLEIFNRWGNLVYKKKQYNNKWDGTSTGRVNIQVDNKLPSGTYFYVLDLGNGTKPKKGWIYINRD
ncbi:gliding motility-associated C-terminal domain-containing protein [Tenacibaculum sp. MAR_2010_89]|uniref:Ig-like domain-containing protein n=1 Tax=Tenacibaculum sp. MAR_2010_89 TaxID=1250198 RepID=UPI000896561A|nr:Ig-like domain-containing protein [Tenacibaculum sp. MAR_2010_89]SEE17148.1 gliding motility-associated C-terminal domain-containing protein [Tenacibaculum sp. MAR_2010_89]